MKTSLSVQRRERHVYDKGDEHNNNASKYRHNIPASRNENDTANHTLRRREGDRRREGRCYACCRARMQRRQDGRVAKTAHAARGDGRVRHRWWSGMKAESGNGVRLKKRMKRHGMAQPSTIHKQRNAHGYASINVQIWQEIRPTNVRR